MKTFPVLCLGSILFAGGPAAPAADRYVSPIGTHVSPFTTWATAATNIQAAVDAAITGDVVWVTNGLYKAGGRAYVVGLTTNRVFMSKAATVRSVNGPDVTIIEGKVDTVDTLMRGAVRGVWLSSGAVLSGFTVRGGGTAVNDNRGGGIYGGNGVVTNCVIVQNIAGIGGGVAGAQVFNCIVRSNVATLRGGGAADCSIVRDAVFEHNIAQGATTNGGGGVFKCLQVWRARFIGNSTPGSGGAALQSTLINCALLGNTAGYRGGASCSNTLISCTLTLNRGAVASFSDALRSCIVWDNLPANVESSVNPEFNCTWPVLAGTGNMGQPPLLSADGIHLTAISPCRGASAKAAVVQTDIDAEAWGNPPSIGCDEYQPGDWRLPPPFIRGTRQPRLTLQLNAVDTSVSPVDCVWYRGGDRLADDDKFEGTETAVLTIRDFTVDDLGAYTYVLSNALGMATSHCAQVVFANAANPTPIYPYTNWVTAAAILQDAVDAAGPGSLILVTNGIYDSGGRSQTGSLTNRVVLDKPVTLFGFNGADLTVIEGRWHPGTTNGATAVRCVWLGDGAVLDGFTLRNGATLNLGDTNSLQCGGGVWCVSTNARVADCVVSNNAAAAHAGGVMRGWLSNSSLRGNWARLEGGGACSNILESCILEGNVAYGGAGAVYAVLTNCVLHQNMGGNHGGGARYCVLDRCILTYNYANYGAGAVWSQLTRCQLFDNRANNGAGAASSKLSQCVLKNNLAADTGGGASGSTLISCALIGNRGARGSGVWSGGLTNCTIVGSTGGGARGTTLYNCIVRGNAGYNYWPDCTLRYTCSQPLAEGEGNTDADPQLLPDQIHIASTSPSRGAGSSAYTVGTDVDGQAWNTAPSQGCDEWHPEPAIFLPPQWTPRSGALPALVWTAFAAGQEPFDSQWIHNGTPIEASPRHASERSLEMVIQPLEAEDAGSYQVVVSNAFGAVTSAVTRVMIHCVDATSATSAFPYTNWFTAAASLQDAVDAAASGALVLVTNGIYDSGGRAMTGDLTNRVVVNKPVTLWGIAGPDQTIIEGAWDATSTNGPGAVRCAWLGSGASLRGFTVRGGATRGTGNDAVTWAGGVWCESVLASVSHCIIKDNRAAGDGAGTFSGTIQSSLIISNVASRYGGGSRSGNLYHCTTLHNAAARGGGSCAATHYNCILWANTAPTQANYDYTAGTANYSCTSPAYTAYSSINRDPQLLDARHIAITSPCRAAGSEAFTTDQDLDNEAWGSPPSMGCDELWEDAVAGPLTVAIESPQTQLFVNRTLPLTGRISGRASRIEWDFGDGPVVTNASYFTSHTWTNAGNYTVTFTAFNHDHPGGVSTNLLVHILPVEQPLVTVDGLTGGNFQLQFPSQSGVNYWVEHAASLTPPIAWQTLTTLTGNGGVMQVADTSATDAARFYRVRAQ